MPNRPAILAAAALLISCHFALAFDEAELFAPEVEAPPAPVSQPVPSARPRNAPPLAQPGVDGRVLTPGHLRLGELPLNPAIDLTVPAVGLWARIRNGFALPDIDSPLVHEQEAWYANRPEYVKRMVARSQRYLYHVVAEIEKRGLPSEIALLPMIESAYNPTAYSRSHASGIWQFIPSTGKLYGLEQNFWQDERRDVLAATRAALDYLEKLYDQFGSWDLALAAYNWGEGAVARAIARNEARGLPTDYQSLTMPRETRYYVPKLQAVKNIVADPAKFGLELPEIPNQPYFTHVTVPQNIDVKLAARLAEMPLEEFLSLNPSHNRPVIRADGGATLLLPMDKARVFATNLENHDKPLVSWQAYTVKRGETLEHVAGKFGTNAAYLRQVNALGSSRKLKVAGHTLLVPMRNLERGGNLDEVGAIRLEARAPAEHGAAAPARRQHVVARGDTLYNIARRYGVSVEQVKSWNGLAANHVAIGQRLAVGGTPAVNGHTHPSQTVRAASAPQPRKKNVTRIAKARTGAAKPQHTVQVQPGKNGQLKVVYAEKKPANRGR